MSEWEQFVEEAKRHVRDVKEERQLDNYLLKIESEEKVVDFIQFLDDYKEVKINPVHLLLLFFHEH